MREHSNQRTDGTLLSTYIVRFLSTRTINNYRVLFSKENKTYLTKHTPPAALQIPSFSSTKVVDAKEECPWPRKPVTKHHAVVGTRKHSAHPPLDKVRKKIIGISRKYPWSGLASSPFHNMNRSIDWYPSNELFFTWSWTLNSSSIVKKPILLYRGVGALERLGCYCSVSVRSSQLTSAHQSQVAFGQNSSKSKAQRWRLETKVQLE